MSLRNRLLVAFILPLIVAGLAILGVSRTLDRGVREANDVAENQETLAAAEAVLKTAIDAETGVRGFSLTGQDKFLDPYQAARVAFPGRLRDLRALVAGSPDELQHVDRIETLFRQWLRDTAEPMILARRHSPFQLVSHVSRLREYMLRMSLAGNGPQTMDHVTAQPLLDSAGAEIKGILDLPLPNDLRQGWSALMPVFDRFRKECSGDSSAKSLCRQEMPSLLAQVDTLADDAWARRDKALDVEAADTGKATFDALRMEAGALNRLIHQHLGDNALKTNDLTRQRGQMGMIALMGTLVLAMLIALAATLRTARAALTLMESAKAIAAGDLARRAPVQTSDELGELAKTFNTMAARIQDREKETALLGEMGDMLQACLTLEEAGAVIGRIGPQIVPHAEGEVLLLNASRNMLVSTARWPESAAPSPPWNPQDCWALRRGQPYRSGGGGGLVPCPHLGPHPPPIAVCIPLTAQGETIGVLSLKLQAARTDGRPTIENPERLRFVRSAAEHVGLALANLKLRDALRQQAIRDPLTGLFNRRYAEETLERELARAKRTNGALTLVMLDVDHFKRFNDAFGHDAGDEVLRSLGELFRVQLRASDLACRYGGEEFLLALIDSSAQASLPRLERIREGCSQLNLQHHGQPLGKVTLSMGVAEGPGQANEVAALITTADAALYQAKKNGRDRIQRAG